MTDKQTHIGISPFDRKLTGFRTDPDNYEVQLSPTDPSSRYPIKRLIDMTRIADPTDQRLLTDVRKNPLFSGLHSFEQWGAATAETVLQLADGLGYIDLSKSRSILDFGAGSGGPTLSLVALAEANGGSVEAIESSELGKGIIDKGILLADQVHLGDGISYLAAPDQRGKYDLVTAFMLGPDSSGELTRSILASAQNALASEGRLLITSDIGTIGTARSVCQGMSLAYEEIAGVPMANGPLPNALVVSFSAK